MAGRVPPASAVRVLWLAAAFEGGLLLLAFALGWALGTPPFAHLRPAWSGLLWGALATVPTLVALRWSLQSDWSPLRRLREVAHRTIVPIFAGCTTLDLGLIALMAGVAEEAFFRGVVQTALAERFDPTLGLVLASVLFGVMHLITPAYALLAALAGAYLGVLLIAFDNLLVPVVVHGLYDGVALVYLGRRFRAVDEVGPDDGAAA